jgi:hypothetical protein
MNTSDFLEEERTQSDSINGRIVGVEIHSRRWRDGNFGNTVQIFREGGYRYYANISPSSFARLCRATIALNNGRQNDTCRYHVKYPKEAQ